MSTLDAGRNDLAGLAGALAHRLPPSMEAFAWLAYNYRWVWLAGGRELFKDLDPLRWELCHENPVRLLQEASAPSLSRAADDPGFIDRARSLEEAVEADLNRPPSSDWPEPEHPIAFLCAEYGIHRSLPMYSGGLGVLAGDILKEASDRALPMVAVGLLYRQGYFHQRLDRSGWQHEHWAEVDPERLPAALVTGPDGAPVTVTVSIAGRPVTVQVWRVDVGRVPLFLLDTHRPENARVDRWITSRLYVGDRRLRLAQYALLGVGGIRALEAMGIRPGLVHLNEGHAALAPLELARREVAAGRTFAEALEEARARTVFTTHTPVAAGNEGYTTQEIADVVEAFAAELGVQPRDVLRLGWSHGDDPGQAFGLTELGLRASRASNAVSRLHGHTARSMWHHLFPDGGSDEVPIGHVTNGVHLPSWMAPSMRSLLDRYLGEDWLDRTSDPATWEGVDRIPDEELWEVRSQLRATLVAYVQDRSVADRLYRGEPLEYAEMAAGTFDPGVLTIGFARRAAGYKRWFLLRHDPERALGLLRGPRPVQIVLAGKSHPQDEEAKRIMRGVFMLKDEPGGAERVAFLEDYDLGMAEHLVRGCDVWLNLPRAPMEASGTSGMKAALNGGLNLSVLDGWWAEAFDGSNGWGIDSDPTLPPAEQDARDAAAFYDLIEREVVPLFHDRDGAGIPREWIRRVKASLKSVGPGFTATRMLAEYLATAYGAVGAARR